MSYSIQQLLTYLASIKLNDDSETADKEVRAILSKNPENNPLSKYTKPKPIHITKTVTYMPKISLPSPKLKTPIINKSLFKKEEPKLQKHLLLRFMKKIKQSQSRDTQEMNNYIKKRKKNPGSTFYVSMEPFKMKNKKIRNN